MFSQMSKGEPIKLSTTHFVFCAKSFISSRNLLGQLMHGDGKSMIAKFELEKPLDFGKHIITSWESKITQMHAHSIMHGRPLPHAFLSSQVFFLTRHSFTLGSLGKLDLLVCFHSRFWLFFSFNLWLGGLFCNAQWLGCLPHELLPFTSFSMPGNSFFCC